MIDKNKRKENMKKYRTTWGILNPVTKIVPDKTKYSRKKKHKRKDADETAKNFSQNKEI